MNKLKKASLLTLVIGFVIILATPTYIHFAITIPANIDYNNKFGANINMITQGSSTLVGTEGKSDEGSMHFYLMRIWNEMNNTWPNHEEWSYTYANEANLWLGTLEDQVPQNTLTATNQYFNSLNATLYTKQEIIDNGSFTSSDDPVQTMISRTRDEINSFGGIDWVIHDLYMHDFRSSAYWSPVTMITMSIIFVGVFCAGSVLLFLLGIRKQITEDEYASQARYCGTSHYNDNYCNSKECSTQQKKYCSKNKNK